MPEAPAAGQPPGIETFQSRSRWDLQPLWQCPQPDGTTGPALAHPWGAEHRPDWTSRGLVIWPRGGLVQRLQLTLPCPEPWRLGEGQGSAPRARARARLVLRWWAERAELWVDGASVHCGDLFDTACRWPLPERWWQGEPLRLELLLRSPLHDDGALIHSRLELEPLDPADPAGLLAETREALAALRRRAGEPPDPGPGAGFHVLGHAHLDLAWLWPVADTWQAAERTFASVLGLMERFPQLHFGHSTPALYAWLQQQRPALMARIQAAVAAGRFEPLNGPWVESDCVLISTASLLRQFQEGQWFSRATFPSLRHDLAWLPDSFGFAAGLPAVAAATGVRWFCTHKLAWNADHPFPHRLFRWRSRDGSELLALMTGPIGTDGDPEAMEGYRLEWQRAAGLPRALWLPGVGDHGGGPTAEMLEHLALWQGQSAAAPQRHGSLRGYLAELEVLAGQLPVWRDELYLELHRGCATSRPDQKRHNRTLERLLREAELAAALAAAWGAASEARDIDWRPLLFQQFHDILPGTSIPEVFEQAEPQWRAARRAACRQRDGALRAWLAMACDRPGGAPGSADSTAPMPAQLWWAVQLQPLQARSRTLRLPPGCWQAGDLALPAQPAAAGGQWVQLPPLDGVAALPLRRRSPILDAGPGIPAERLSDPVVVTGSRCTNGLLGFQVGAAGLEQFWGADGEPLLAGPLQWCRYRDQGEFWDAWDLAADARQHPLTWSWQGSPAWLERGPLCASFVWRGHCGRSPVRLQGRLLAGSPWLELILRVDWRQRHELLRLEVPLAGSAPRWAADTSGGVIERPTEPCTARERARWEVTAISWLASAGTGRADLAVLLDGPQGVSAAPRQLGVSLLRGPTWPDPGADNGWQRQRLALLPCAPGWCAAGVPEQAVAFREPVWLRPVTGAPDQDSAAEALAALPPLPRGLQLIGLRRDPAASTAESLVISVQNLTPARRRLDLGDLWELRERLDGLGEPCAEQPGAGLATAGPAELGPWQLASWRISRRDRRRDR
jgi:alpha-mannosidase